MSALLDVRGLTRRPWFEGKDLAAAPGEIVVLSGPTGSGKTLFLRTIADLDPSEGGEAFVDGEARASMPAWRWRGRVLYVHPGGVRLPGTVADNLAAVARGRPPPDPPFDPAVDAARLSTGEGQVLALERALLCGPRVLLLDEATSGMDPRTAARFEERLKGWVREGRAIVWVSHDPDLAGRVGARAEAFP